MIMSEVLAVEVVCSVFVRTFNYFFCVTYLSTFIAVALIGAVRRVRERVRDDRYLIGQRLVNAL